MELLLKMNFRLGWCFFFSFILEGNADAGRVQAAVSFLTNSSYQEIELKSESSLSLRDILPVKAKYYDKNRAPKLLGQPTIVYFHVTVLSLDSINEESMTYVADIFLAQSWRDPRLRLPENMHEEYRILDVEWLNKIWRPDCFFKNAKKVTFHEMSIPNHYLWLYHDKTLLYMSKLTLVLSCAMKFESYPHDTQSCSMMIESLSHTVHDLVFIWNLTDPLVVNPDIELPQLDISNNYTSDCTIEYSTGNFTCLAIVFNLRRRLGYHLFHTYIPSALIVVMSWISFWIKPEAIPARVTLGVTSLLTLATQNTQSQQSLPPVSYVKAIDVWMSSCSVFVFLSLFEFAVVNNYMGPVATKAMKGYSDEDLSRDLDAFKHIFPNSVDPRASTSATIPQYETFCNGRETAVYIDRFSRFFFPFSFFILNVVYWSTFFHIFGTGFEYGKHVAIQLRNGKNIPILKRATNSPDSHLVARFGNRLPILEAYSHFVAGYQIWLLNGTKGNIGVETQGKLPEIWVEILYLLFKLEVAK